MKDIADFLLARIAEDEAVAIADAGFMQEFNPARILAECEAKRLIAEAHQGLLTAQRQLKGDELGETITRIGAAVSEGVLRLLAAVYVDHPDYNPAWRPKKRSTNET